MFFEDDNLELDKGKENETTSSDEVEFDVQELLGAIQSGPVTIGPCTLVCACSDNDAESVLSNDLVVESPENNEIDESEEVEDTEDQIPTEAESERETVIAELQEILMQMEETGSVTANEDLVSVERNNECAGGCSARQQLSLARRALIEAQRTIQSVVELLDLQIRSAEPSDEILTPPDEGETRHGVYVGEHMLGNDGNYYQVPANYASKSRLVEGDLLRLSILPNGSHVYKQIGPVERLRLQGRLVRGAHGGWEAQTDRGRYRLLESGVNYHRGEEGQKVVVLVPKGLPARHAAIEALLKGEE